MNAPAAPTSFSRAAAGAVLGALLLVLAFRLTAAESLRDTLAQKIAAVAQEAAPKTEDSPGPVPIVGPVFIAGYAAVVWLLAGAATLLAGRCGALGLRRLGQLGVVLLIVALGLGSTFQAANRFNALIGTADVAAALGAAWIVLLLCHERLLGARGRQAVMAAVVAILTLGAAKGLMQYFVEFPDTLRMVNENPDKALRENGINPDDPAQKALFMARLKSAEVSGFGALSNVFATQMIADVTLLAALGMAGLVLLKPPPVPPARRRGQPAVEPARGEIPVHVIALAAVGGLLLAGLAMFPMTQSKGGSAATALAIIAVVLGCVFRKQVAARRKTLLAALALAVAALAAGVIGYGLVRHSLPTRSLMFRWQYWMGSVPMVQGHPLWGVGLNNFGDYYLRFKSPAWPEDVKDPHSFFVRWAAEAGLPATLAVGGLLVWLLQGALGRKAGGAAEAGMAKPGDAATGLLWPLIAGAGVAAAWVPLHFLAEAPNAYTVMVTCLMAVLAWGVYAAVLALCVALRAEAMRYLALGAVAAALAMLLYDQINMALVTGPVAMLFWMLLALGDASGTDSVQSKIENGGGRKSKILPCLVSMIPLGTGLAALAALVIPLAAGTFSWDPAPYEYAYIRRIIPYSDLRQIKAEDAVGALEALDEAIARSPNSVELLVQRIILLRDVLRRPVGDDIRRVLSLDQANASLRIMLALPDSDLPAPERVAALEQALAFDAQLPRDEVKRLTPEQIRQIRDTIARLK